MSDFAAESEERQTHEQGLEQTQEQTHEQTQEQTQEQGEGQGQREEHEEVDAGVELEVADGVQAADEEEVDSLSSAAVAAKPVSAADPTQRPRAAIPKPSKEFDDIDYDMTMRVNANSIKFGYDGDLDANGRKHGRGILRYVDGNVYEGTFLAGQRHGYGILRYANGDIYEGQWRNGKKEGQAKFIFKSTGDIYDGSWVADKRQGHGVYVYADNSVYEGTFLNNRKNGHGKFSYPSGEVHEGYVRTH